jgi:hypothetical protein
MKKKLKKFEEGRFQIITTEEIERSKDYNINILKDTRKSLKEQLKETEALIKDYKNAS